MTRLPFLVILVVPLVLAACNRNSDSQTSAAVEQGVMRSVADVQAATAAASAPETEGAKGRQE